MSGGGCCSCNVLSHEIIEQMNRLEVLLSKCADSSQKHWHKECRLSGASSNRSTGARKASKLSILGKPKGHRAKKHSICSKASQESEQILSDHDAAPMDCDADADDEMRSMNPKYFPRRRSSDSSHRGHSFRRASNSQVQAVLSEFVIHQDETSACEDMVEVSKINAAMTCATPRLNNGVCTTSDTSQRGDHVFETPNSQYTGQCGVHCSQVPQLFRRTSNSQAQVGPSEFIIHQDELETRACESVMDSLKNYARSWLNDGVCMKRDTQKHGRDLRGTYNSQVLASPSEFVIHEDDEMADVQWSEICGPPNSQVQVVPCECDNHQDDAKRVACTNTMVASNIDSVRSSAMSSHECFMELDVPKRVAAELDVIGTPTQIDGHAMLEVANIAQTNDNAVEDQACFDGLWFKRMSKSRFSISGTTLTWNNDTTSIISQDITGTKFTVECEGEEYTAELIDNGLLQQQLHWSDGDIWYKACGISVEEMELFNSVAQDIENYLHHVQPTLLTTRLVSGREVMIDVTGFQSMSDLRKAIAHALELKADFVAKLIHNCNILDDFTPISDIITIITNKEELTIIVEQNKLRWRPPHLLHKGRVVEEILRDENREGYIYVFEDGTESLSLGTPLLDGLFTSMKIAPQLLPCTR